MYFSIRAFFCIFMYILTLFNFISHGEIDKYSNQYELTKSGPARGIVTMAWISLSKSLGGIIDSERKKN